MTTAARLRHRITLQELRVVGRNPIGGEIKDWVDVAPVWASIEPFQGNEFFAAQQVQAKVSHRIKIRYRQGVTPKMRVLFGTRIFELESVINYNERNEELHLMAVEKVI